MDRKRLKKGQLLAGFKPMTFQCSDYQVSATTHELQLLPKSSFAYIKEGNNITTVSSDRPYNL